MTFRRTFIASPAAAILAFSFVPQAFAAIDADEVFDGIVRQMSVQGIELSAESVTLKGNDILVSGLKVTVAGGNDGAQIESVLLEDVSEAAGGAYVIGKIAAPSYSQSKDGYALSLEGATIEGYYVSAPGETDPIVKAGIYRALNIGAVEISQNSDTLFSFDGMSAVMSPYEPGGTLDFTATFKDFAVDFTKISDPKAKGVAAALGYDELRGRMDVKGTWNTSSGDLSGTEVIELDNAATLNLDLEIGGYTAELLGAMQEMRATMKDQGQEAMNFAMMGLMQQLSVGKVSIELVDDSATGRILDFAAAQQGTNRESVIAQAKGTLPFALAQLQNPEFAAKVTAAVATFLDNPRSLKLVAAPAAPVSVAQIMGSAMSAPQALIGVLGLDISANE